MADGTDGSPSYPLTIGNGKRDNYNEADSVELTMVFERCKMSRDKFNVLLTECEAVQTRIDVTMRDEWRRERMTHKRDGYKRRHGYYASMRPGRAALRRPRIQHHSQPIRSEDTSEYGNVDNTLDEARRPIGQLTTVVTKTCEF